MAAGQKITICITGVQTAPFAEAGLTTKQLVEAEYYQRGDSGYLFYEEWQEGFANPWKTRIKQKGDTLEIHRQGPGGSTMYFEPGISYRTEYHTPYGVVLLDIVTTVLQVEKVQSGEEESRWQKVTVEYDLENAGEKMGHYLITIEQK